jgi:hypothetical protein
MTVKWKTNSGKIIKKDKLSIEDKKELITTLQRVKFFLSQEKQHFINAGV